MAADSPWIKWWTDDFLMGVVDLAADEIGVYTVLLNLMASRGGPIPDDRRWLARRCGTGTRRFNQIIDKLTDLGKLQHREGLIGNRRMIEEMEKRSEKSAKARSSSMARWHADQAELELEAGTASRAHTRPPESTQNARKSGRKNQEQKKLIPPKKEQKSSNPAKTSDANASGLAGARVRSSEDSERDSSQPNGTDSGARTREGPTLAQAYSAVCRAAGFKPTDPAAIDRAMTHVEKWLDEGWDLDHVILPSIAAEIAASDQPTRTLGRFNKRIRHEAARHSATKQRSQPKMDNEAPKLEPPGEPAIFKPVRQALLERIGPAKYARYFNDLTFEDAEECQGDQRPIKVKGIGPFIELAREHHAKDLIAVAKPHGFTAVWW